MLTYDPSKYRVIFIDDIGKATPPMPLVDFSADHHGPSTVVLNGRAYKVTVEDLGFVATSTDFDAPAERNRLEAVAAAAAGAD